MLLLTAICHAIAQAALGLVLGFYAWALLVDNDAPTIIETEDGERVAEARKTRCAGRRLAG